MVLPAVHSMVHGPWWSPRLHTGGALHGVVRNPAGHWVLHGDMYTHAQAPVLDDPANTTTLYVRREPPTEPPSSRLTAPADSKPGAPSPPSDRAPLREGPPGPEGPPDPATAPLPPPGPQGGTGTEEAGIKTGPEADTCDGAMAALEAADAERRSPLPNIWMGRGLDTSSSYSSSSTERSQFSYNEWPKPPGNTPGGRARKEEVRHFKICCERWNAGSSSSARLTNEERPTSPSSSQQRR